MTFYTSLQRHPFQYQRTQSCPLPRIRSTSSSSAFACGGSKTWLEDEACWERRAQLEQEFTTNFKCCGIQLQDLHSLLDHFETAHQPPLSVALDLDFSSVPCLASPHEVDLTSGEEPMTPTRAVDACVARNANKRAPSPVAVEGVSSSWPYRPLSPPASPGSLEPLDLVVMPSQFAKSCSVTKVGTLSRTVHRPPTPISDHDHLSDFEHDHDSNGHELSLFGASSAQESTRHVSATASTTKAAALCPLPTPSTEGCPMAKPVVDDSNRSPIPSLPPGVFPIYSTSIPSFRINNILDDDNKDKLVPLPSLPALMLSTATASASTKTACPVVGCPKKYSSASGLRYHLHHAHEGVAQTMMRTKRRKCEPY